MINAQEKIVETLFTLLNGNLAYNGEVMDVVSVPPKGEGSDYVLIGETNMLEVGTKTNFAAEYSIQLQIVTGFQPKSGSKKKMYSIANQIMKKVKPFPISHLNLGSTYNNYFLYLESANEDLSMERSERSSRYIIRYRMGVEMIETNTDWYFRMINEGYTIEALECVSNN